MKKILFLITKSNLGGAQQYVYDLATSLDRDSYAVAVALGGNGELAHMLRTSGIRTITLPSLVRDVSFKKEIASFWEIYQILKTERPHILHVNSSKAGGIGAFIGRFLRIERIVYTAHGWAFNENRSFPSRLFVGFFHWLTIMCAHVTITVSEETKRQMRWPGAHKKMVTIHNGKKPVVYKERRNAREELINTHPELSKIRNELWAGTIAELHPVKRHDIAISAIKAVRDKGMGLCHIIIGDGEEAQELRALIAELGLQEHVFLLGHIKDAARFLKAFDIFILASRSEALSYAVIEAGQAGLPIVATRVGGIPEILTHEKNGILVERENAEALASALALLHERSDLREKYGQAAKESSAAFSLEKMLRETEAVYLR